MSEQKAEKKFTIRASSLWKVSAIILLLTVLGLLAFTQPWNRVADNPRTIEITGEATIKRAPDSFVFNPTYEAKSQEAINQKTTEVVAAVKALGLGDAGIQTSISSYDNYDMNGPTGEKNYTNYLTLSVEDKELAQKIQDYLVTSGATGQISPSVSFKRDTQRQLKDEATTLAIEDARRRAEQTAQNLGVKLGKVIKINEPTDDYGVYPIASYDASLKAEGSGLPINAGESEFTYSVNVVFEIR
jgi:uncharacterized protein YggE